MIINYLIDSLRSVGLQLLILFGPLLVFGLCMHYLSVWIERLSINLVGRNGYLYLFAWLGTTVHELGHAIFAVLFGHRIEEMKLFSPDPKTGTLGYVKHSWNRKNFYQVIGNFFIGIGPVILGTLVLFIMIMLLYGISTGEGFTVTGLSFSGIGDSLLLNLKNLAISVFLGPQSSWWKTLILFFVLLSVGTSVKLSPPDIAGAAKGFLIIILLLVVINLATHWSGDFLTSSFTWLSSALSGFYFLMILSVIINAAFLMILGLLLLLKRMI